MYHQARRASSIEWIELHYTQFVDLKISLTKWCDQFSKTTNLLRSFMQDCLSHTHMNLSCKTKIVIVITKSELMAINIGNGQSRSDRATIFLNLSQYLTSKWSIEMMMTFHWSIFWRLLDDVFHTLNSCLSKFTVNLQSYEIESYESFKCVFTFINVRS